MINQLPLVFEGFVKLNEENFITDFIEKPETFISDLAIIGIYYFKSGETLKAEIKYLLDNDIKEKGEYQLTNALENMKAKGLKFKPGKVTEWWDCGNKNATVFTNQRFLATTDEKNLISKEAALDNVEIIEPCFIAEGVEIINSKIGPFVSIGKNTKIQNSQIENSIIQENSFIENGVLNNSMIGNHVVYNGKSSQVSLGDYCTQEN
jgi:glucose-1-phosphate thymidylyltransferase